MIQSLPVRAVIFDFDGVIADTIPIHYESYRRLFAEEGVSFSYADYLARSAGKSRVQTIRSVLGSRISRRRLERLASRKGEIVLEVVARDGMIPLPGAVELTRSIRRRGLKTAVASSSRTAEIFLELLGIRQLFDAVTDAQLPLRAKPAPDLYLATAEAIGELPRDCLAIEDAAVGIRAARDAGMRVIAVTSTSPASELAGADRVLSTLAGLDAAAILET